MRSLVFSIYVWPFGPFVCWISKNHKGVQVAQSLYHFAFTNWGIISTPASHKKNKPFVNGIGRYKKIANHPLHRRGRALVERLNLLHSSPTSAIFLPPLCYCCSHHRLIPAPHLAGDVLLMDIAGRIYKREIARKRSIPYVLLGSDIEAETAAIEVIGLINGRKRRKIASFAVSYKNSRRVILSGPQRCSGHSSLPQGASAIYQSC